MAVSCVRAPVSAVDVSLGVGVQAQIAATTRAGFANRCICPPVRALRMQSAGGAACSAFSASMSELPLPRKYHRHTVLVRRGDHLSVAYGTSGLDDGRDTRFGGLVDAVAEGKERIRAQYRARCHMIRGARLVDGEEGRVDTRHLSRADPDCRAVACKHDGVGL